ncbi:hypothetical protein [Streptomyces marincola]|uniref:hypothetical protein n=1 Tax=Streptomyces marincola TaxID=2878388 RepID=UPI001CF5341C|nr:hypothetical protein [Streptomyces marincola]UCM89410.1 hypothetical protein LC193_16445 [Streptomyces marincola]
MSDGDLELNPDAARDVEAGTGESDRLAAMRAKFIDIASAQGLFGTAPNGAAAEAALASAASAMLTELERAGISVQDISESAAETARLADETDEAARSTLHGVEDPVTYMNNFLNSTGGGGGSYYEVQ